MPAPVHRLAVAVLIATCLGAAGLAAADGPTPFPNPKDEAAWPGKGPIRVFAYMSDNRKAFWNRRAADQGKVVFVGDSLTGGWAALAKGTAFPALQIANRGIGGDTSRGTLFRFQEDVLDLHPRAIVITSGANDLSAHGANADTIANLGAMVAMARQQDPEVPIVICTIPPAEIAGSPDIPGSRQDMRTRIQAFGSGKAKLAVLDLMPIFGDAQGKLIPELYNKDHVHPNPDGYVKWAAALAPVLDGLGVK